MILYTIQPEHIFLEFQQTGILKAHNDIICHKSFENSYRWMENIMETKLGEKYRHPVWAWYKYNGKNNVDLRFRAHLPKGEIGYKIEFEIPDNEVILSDFTSWHLVLMGIEEDFKNNYTFIDLLSNISSEDVEIYLKEGCEIFEDKIIFNWDKIILDKNSSLDYIQATIWEVTWEQVKSFKKFKSR